MDIMKTLILGWSLVLSSTLFFKGANNASIFAAVLYRSTEQESSLLWITPLYVFCVWLAGCVVVLSLCVITKGILNRSTDKER